LHASIALSPKGLEQRVAGNACRHLAKREGGVRTNERHAVGEKGEEARNGRGVLDGGERKGGPSSYAGVVGVEVGAERMRVPAALRCHDGLEVRAREQVVRGARRGRLGGGERRSPEQHDEEQDGGTHGMWRGGIQKTPDGHWATGQCGRCKRTNEDPVPAVCADGRRQRS
jgi:hypothetical protein